MRMAPLLIIAATLVGIAGAASPGWAGPTNTDARPATDEAAAPARQYQTIDLGTLGGSQSQARAINDRGQIVGDSDTGDGSIHPFLWQRGTMTDLGILGGYQARASAINNRGQVVGTSDTPSGFQHAFLWQRGTMTDLGTLGGYVSSATGINDRGEVTGVSLTADGGGWHAFLWRDGVMQDIGRFDAADINDQELVVGTTTCVEGGTYPPGPICAMHWRRGVVTKLGEPARRATAVNDRGEIIGTIETSDGNVRGFVWRNGRLIDVGTLGGDSSTVHDINDRGQVVGSSSPGQLQPQRPFLWHAGVMVDLTTRGLDQDAFAVGIDGQGRLVGSVGGHAALFTPKRPA